MNKDHIQMTNRLKIAKSEKDGTDAKTTLLGDLKCQQRQRERHRKTD